MHFNIYPVGVKGYIMSIEYLKSEHVEFKNGKSINRVELAFSTMSELSQVKVIVFFIAAKSPTFSGGFSLHINF